MRSTFVMQVSLLFLIVSNLSLNAQFQDGGSFQPLGDANALSSHCYQITPDEKNQLGAIWWSNPIALNQAFELEFTFYAGDKNGNGGDGFALVFQDDPRGKEAIGRRGAGLGFGDHQADNFISPSIAIEFDTRRHTLCDPVNPSLVPPNDPIFDHTTVVYNGKVCKPEFNPVPIHAIKEDVEDNTCYEARLTWTPLADGRQQIRLFVDGELRFTHIDDMINSVFGGQSTVNFGFTGSTGESDTNEQSICMKQSGEGPSAPVFRTTFRKVHLR